MWHAFKKHDGKVVAASSMELKANDINYLGWEMRRDRTCRDIDSSEMGGQCC